MIPIAEHGPAPLHDAGSRFQRPAPLDGPHPIQNPRRFDFVDRTRAQSREGVLFQGKQHPRPIPFWLMSGYKPFLSASQ